MVAYEALGACSVFLQEEVAAGQRDERRAGVLRLRREPLRRQLAPVSARQDGVGREVAEVLPRRRGADRLTGHLEDPGFDVGRARELDLPVGPVDEAPPDVGGERFGGDHVERLRYDSNTVSRSGQTARRFRAIVDM